MEPRVMAHSQSHRLRERMAEAAIRHGQEVRADLPNVRVSAQVPGWRTGSDPQVGVIFFCNMESLRVREVISAGDGGALPDEVVLEGLAVPEPGAYDILNAVIHSNGALRVRVDSETRIVPRRPVAAEVWL